MKKLLSIFAVLGSLVCAPSFAQVLVSPQTLTNAFAYTVRTDNNSFQLGIKFSADVPGYIDGVRWYKQPGANATHVVDVFTASGTLIETYTTVAEPTTLGWVTAYLPSPVLVPAGTQMVVTWHRTTTEPFTQPNVGTLPAFPFTVGHLTAINGLYTNTTSTSTFPTSSTTLYVDVLWHPAFFGIYQ